MVLINKFTLIKKNFLQNYIQLKHGFFLLSCSKSEHGTLSLQVRSGVVLSQQVLARIIQEKIAVEHDESVRLSEAVVDYHAAFRLSTDWSWEKFQSKKIESHLTLFIFEGFIYTTYKVSVDVFTSITTAYFVVSCSFIIKHHHESWISLHGIYRNAYLGWIEILIEVYIAEDFPEQDERYSFARTYIDIRRSVWYYNDSCVTYVLFIKGSSRI